MAVVVRFPNRVRLPDLVRGPEVEQDLAEGEPDVTGIGSGWPWALPPGQDLVVALQEPPLAFIEPVGVAMLSAWRTHCGHKVGARVRADDTTRSPRAWRTGMLRALSGRGVLPPADGFPVQIVREADLTQGVLDGPVERLGIRDEATREVVVHCLEDLCRNVFDHAETHGQGAHVAAHFDPNSGLIRLGVADCGKGIAQDMRDNLGPDLTDRQAVEAAVQPKVTGSNTSGMNVGVGLYIVRRLALAAQGRFWGRTGRVTVRASADSPQDFQPTLVEEGNRWQGTAVGLMLHAGVHGPFQQTMARIRDDIEGRGPRFRDMQFFKQALEDERWVRVHVAPDARALAVDRPRARRLADEQVAPLLAEGRSVQLDFSGTRVATQSFCHALLSELFREHGVELLDRVRFIACSAQVEPLIRLAVNAGLREA